MPQHPLQRMDIALDHGVCVKGTGIPRIRIATDVGCFSHESQVHCKAVSLQSQCGSRIRKFYPCSLEDMEGSINRGTSRSSILDWDFPLYTIQVLGLPPFSGLSWGASCLSQQPVFAWSCQQPMLFLYFLGCYKGNVEILGFPEIEVPPKSSILMGFSLVYKPSIWGDPPHFRKPPYDEIFQIWWCTDRQTRDDTWLMGWHVVLKLHPWPQCARCSPKSKAECHVLVLLCRMMPWEWTFEWTRQWHGSFVNGGTHKSSI